MPITIAAEDDAAHKSHVISRLALNFDLRVLLESEIASLAAARMTAASIAQLVQLQDEIETRGTDIDAGNTARIGPINREFHRVIAQASQNSRLVSMLSNAIAVPIVQQTFRHLRSPILDRDANAADADAVHD